MRISCSVGLCARSSRRSPAKRVGAPKGAILRSTPGRCPFAARVGCPRETGRFTSRVVFDGQAVCVAQAPLFRPHVVTQGRKLVTYGLRYAALDQERVRRDGAYAGG